MKRFTVLFAYGVPGLLVAILAVAFLFRDCHGTNTGEKLPEPVRRSIVTLDSNAAPFRASRDSARSVEMRVSAEAARSSEVARRAVTASRLARHRADSLAALATEWHGAYVARTEEADSLRSAASASDSAYRGERTARLTLAASYRADSSRRVAVERLNGDLRDAVAHLERPCRLVGPVPCPSRTVSAVGAGILGVLAGSRDR